MSKLLKILHLEDLSSDAEMAARVLRKAGIAGEILVVDDKDDFTRALKDFSPDIILSDHSLPSFDSHEALRIVKEKGIDVPFILVTATVSEEYAVNIIKDGASDYILKDRLQRLPNAISAAIEKNNLEAAGKLAAETLRSSERKYKLLFESNPMPMWMISKSTLDVIAVNEAAVIHYGYAKEEFLRMNAVDLRPDEDIPEFQEHIQKKNTGISKSRIWRHKKKDGTIIMVDIMAHDVLYEDIPARLVLANDVTVRLKADAEIERQRILQQKLIAETSIKVQEREREEIGKELHDNINQILATAKLYLDSSIKKEGQHTELLQKSKENIILAIEEIRKLSHTLVAPSLGDITLTKAIKELINNLHLATQLQIELSMTNYNENAVNNDIKLMIYRIIQEQVNNILKHSRAKNAIIQLSIKDELIYLTVEDDGIGFDSSKSYGGIGLRNINNRAGFYDGITRVISEPGKGCTLEVSIPVENAK
ncbi:MAG: PAS domain S-box protein [Chitinophagaceae bacterium]|nr:MAG: PAS domain S-box protein [Chitinophagaceae bacterium]